MSFVPFAMERWQSRFEHRVRHNLSESGVHPLTARELQELAGHPVELGSIPLGYGQSNGSEALRARVAALYPGAGPDQVVVTTGGAEANFAAAWWMLESGLPCAALVPTYMQIPGILAGLGSPVRPVPLEAHRGWQPDLDALADALEGGARAIAVTHPNNPTGAALTPESMEGILELADRFGAWILSDEVYAGAEVGPAPTPSFWGRHPRILVTGSLSKAYGLPGLRVGWVVGPPPVAEDLWARTDYTTIAPASLSDALAVTALEPGTRARLLDRGRRLIRENLAVLTDWVARWPGTLQFSPPDAGAIAFPAYSVPVPSMALARWLKDEMDVLVVPGEHFGVEGRLRIGIGGDPAGFPDALDRLGRALEHFKETS